MPRVVEVVDANSLGGTAVAVPARQVCVVLERGDVGGVATARIDVSEQLDVGLPNGRGLPLPFARRCTPREREDSESDAREGECAARPLHRSWAR
jgi:hypothetical protein